MKLNRLLRYLDLPNLIFPSSLHGNRAGSAALQRSLTDPGYRRGGGWTFHLFICPTVCACLCQPAVSLPVLHTPLCLFLPPLSLFLVQISGIHSLFFLPVRLGLTQRPTDSSAWGSHPGCWCSQRLFHGGLWQLGLTFCQHSNTFYPLRTWYFLSWFSCCLWQQTHQVV